MWGGSEAGPDPGGTEGGDRSTGSSQELIDLKDQFEQQQVLIAQLKEMLRKTEKTNVTQENVEEYANTLTRMSARVKKSRMKRGELTDETNTVSMDTPASEKIMLLRQQLEENKLRLAQRGKFQKGMEETVSQLQAQFDDSQQLISQTPLNLSAVEPKSEHYSIESSPEELYNLLVNKDKKLAELHDKVLRLEANVLDLQENVKEKDSVIDARTKAITLMTESLSKKGKNTLDALDDTKEQMRKMQENFINLEMDMKNEKLELQKDSEQKTVFINNLQLAYSSLEQDNAQLQSDIVLYKSNATDETEVTRITQLTKELEEKNNEILQLRSEINVSQSAEALHNRITELEALNLELTKLESPQRHKKGKKGQKKDTELQKIIDNTKEECEKYRTQIMEHELTIQELNLTVAELKNVKKPVEETEDLAKLKKQIDDGNKNMIKIKAQNKSKIKELNKKIEELKKTNDGVTEHADNVKFKERIDVLEKENADLISKLATGATLTDRVKELEVQLFEQSELLDTKNQSLDSLEAQLKSYKTELTSLSERFNKLSQIENDQVASEMTSIHFEEQLDNLELEKKSLIEKNEEMLIEKESLLEKLDAVIKEKQEISCKLDGYMQENMDLIDKLEKLSAEKVSSAESIEMVEGLTQQEKLELEAYQHSLELASGNVHENLEQNPELNESVNRLTEETSDLLRKIELFTEERKEVMEKMEALASENNHLNMKIQEIENNREVLSETYEHLQNEKETMERERNALKLLEADLNNEINQLKKENEILKQEMKHGSENEQSISFETVLPLEIDEVKSTELQKQIDEYRSLVEIQKSEIKELKVELLSYKDLPAANKELHEKISLLQEQYEALLSDNDKLNKAVKESGEIVKEKQEIETELIATRKRINEFNEKLTDNLDELENYKSIIEENKDELISSCNIISELQNKVQEKQDEIFHYQQEVSHLNSVIAELNSALSHLDNENQKNDEYSDTIEIMSTQLQELKMLLNENINQIEVYQQELQQNSDTVLKLNIQLKELNSKLLNMEHELECKDDEISKLVKERDNKDVMIVNLQSELTQKDQHFHQVCDTLNQKYVVLQQQIEQNAGSLSNIKDPLSKIEALENKNKEQLEKMKKIAANLKKKSTAYLELEQKYNELNMKFENNEKETVQLKSTSETQESKTKLLAQQLQEIQEEFAKVQDALSQKTRESASHLEMEQKYNELNQKFKNNETENINLKTANKTQETKMKLLLEQLQEIEEEFANVQNALSQKTNELNRTTHEIAEMKQVIGELQNSKQQFDAQLNALRSESEMLSFSESNRLNMEINEKNEIIQNLTQRLENTQYHAETNSNALKAKVREMEMVVENQEADITRYNEKVSKLEEFISAIEERRLSLEKRTVELDAQLLEKSNSYEEISQAEDMLEQRLAALMVHDEQIEKRLRDCIKDNQELIESNQRLTEENDHLKQHLSTSTEKNLKASFDLEQLKHLQSDNVKQSELINKLQANNKHFHDEYERKLKDKMNEAEALEIEQQNQLEQFGDERKMLIVQCEQLQDRLKEYSDMQTRLNDEIEQYKQKLDQQQVDFDEHINEFEKLSEDNKKNLRIIEELNWNYQEFKNKVEELQTLLTMKCEEILEYQKQVNEVEMLKSQLQEYDDINLKLTEHNLNLTAQIRELNKGNSEKTKEPEKSQPITTFVWPEELKDDPFDFVKQIEAAELPIQAVSEILLESEKPETENNEDLLNKIKTLQFMLYNTEKEKEDVLMQCQELTNEIARLIYEKQNPLDAQVCSSEDTKISETERRQLHEIEFTRACKSDEAIESTSAYLCYKCKTLDDLSNATLAPDLHTEIDPQIILPQDAKITDADMHQLQKLEFAEAKSHVDLPLKHQQPITEDLVQCKTAYLCYPSSNQIVDDNTDQSAEGAVALDAFDENDDGWGCGADEAKLEDDYRQRSVMNRNLNLHIEELDEKVRALELERERHLDEIKQLQIKSGKLIKKLKELKSANDKLHSDLKKSNDFGGLDDAIQDELKSQITQLEKRMKDTNVELQKERAEKSNLLQKVSALQTSNDRMTETKEKQDVEFIVMQRQNRELTVKLEQFEWGNDGFDSPVHVKTDEKVAQSNLSVDAPEKKIAELNETIKELTLDNEDLQTMLEEQRTLRINAEKSKSMVHVAENMKTEAEYLQVVAEKNALHDRCLEDKKRTQEELNALIKSKAELKINLDRLKAEKSNFEMQLAQISLTLENNRRQNQECQTLAHVQLEDSQQKILELNNRVGTLENACQELQRENAKLEEVQNNSSLIGEEKSVLLERLQETNTQFDNLKASLAASEKRTLELEKMVQQSQTFAKENEALVEQMQRKDAELMDKSNQLEEATLERVNYTASLQQLSDEWSQRVEQRGNDIAESWKLHLEVQENEFTQIQKQLQKEIHDLEEKCNALVNENNELRKNVDAEIRNEVDKISALQQQINNRQLYINELSETVHEQQTKLNEQQQQLTNVNNVLQEKDTQIIELESLVNSLKVNVTIVTELTEKLRSVEDLQRQLNEHIELIETQGDELRAKQDVIDGFSVEIQNKDSHLTQVMDQLKKLEVEKELECNKVHMLENQIGDITVQLQEKLTNIDSLQAQISSLDADRENDSKTNAELIRATLALEEKQKETDALSEQLQNYKQLDELIKSKDSQLSELTIEINNVKLLLNEKEKEYNYYLESTTQQHLQKEFELKTTYDKLLLAKDSELEHLTVQLQEQTHNNETFINLFKEHEVTLYEMKTELNSKTQECEMLNHKLLEDETLEAEENKQLIELSQIIEDQVLKIEDLKQDLYEKSKDYDALIAELDLRKPSQDQHQHQTSYQQSEAMSVDTSLDDYSNLEPISRAELDLALYMLHQRDVRCEELTVELMQLLEERDTLQLKLSNAIREKEELRRQYTPDVMSESSGEIPKLSSLASASVASGINEEREVNERTPLANKLSELRSLGYRKDKTLLDEREQRRLLQLSLMHQHRDDASRLPSEAAARLVQEAGYTLSRDVQSPSKVLLNWLWGKSTPKVNNI